MRTHCSELLISSSSFENDTASMKDSKEEEEEQQEDKVVPQINSPSVHNVRADVPDEISLIGCTELVTPSTPKFHYKHNGNRVCVECSKSDFESEYCVNCKMKINHILKGEDTPKVKCLTSYNVNGEIEKKVHKDVDKMNVNSPMASENGGCTSQGRKNNKL